jgi:hypothetical protein
VQALYSKRLRNLFAGNVAMMGSALFRRKPVTDFYRGWCLLTYKKHAPRKDSSADDAKEK